MGTVQAGVDTRTKAYSAAGDQPAAGAYRSFVLLAFIVTWSALVITPICLVVIYSLLRKSDIDVEWSFSTAGYQALTEYDRDQTIVRTFRIALTTTAILLIVAFPAAYWLAKRVKRAGVQATFLILLTVPFFLSEDSRTVIWLAVYGRTGLINTFLQSLGVIDRPIDALLYSEWSLYLGFIPIYFGVMVFPIWLAMTLTDDRYIEASRDLGGSWFHVFRDVVVPLSAPGIIAGIIFTFVPLLGEIVVPSLLGGGNVVMMGSLIQSLTNVFQYPTTAAMAVLITLVVMILLAALMRVTALRGGFSQLSR